MLDYTHIHRPGLPVVFFLKFGIPHIALLNKGTTLPQTAELPVNFSLGLQEDELMQ